MANNPDFKKVVVKNVKLVWPRLDQPYRFNERDKQSEACAATAPGAAYSLSWEMPMDDAKALWAELKEHYEGCRTRNSKLPDFSDVFGRKKDEENNVALFAAKKMAMSRDGSANKPPKVVGLDLKPLEGDDLRIWTGSVGHVRALAFPSTNPQNGQGGISLLLDAVQVIDAQYGSDGLEDDFGPAVEKDPDFGDSAQAPAETPAQQPETSAAGF